MLCLSISNYTKLIIALFLPRILYIDTLFIYIYIENIIISRNHIMGNQIKNLSFSYIRLTVISAIVVVLADSGPNLIVQSVVTLKSFVCGVDANVHAVLDARAFP